MTCIQLFAFSLFFFYIEQRFLRLVIKAFHNGPRINHRHLEQQNAKNYCSTSLLLKSSQFVAKSIYYASCLDVRDLTGY